MPGLYSPRSTPRVGATARPGRDGFGRAAFRHALKKAREEIDKMLPALQQQLDSQALFGDLPAPPPQIRRGGDDDAALITMITSSS